MTTDKKILIVSAGLIVASAIVFFISQRRYKKKIMDRSFEIKIR